MTTLAISCTYPACVGFPWPRWLPRPPLVDVAAALLLAAAGQGAIWTGATVEGPRNTTVWTGLLLTLPLAWRRAAVTGAALCYLVGGLAQALLADSASSIWALAALLLMSFSVGVGTRGRRRVWLGLLFVATIWVTVLVMPDAQLGDRLFTAPLFGAGPLLVGAALQRQQSRAERLARATVLLERDREERAREAVAAERARIARELHDVVAHAVSVMVVQSGAAEELMTLDPARARLALQAVRESGKQSLAELRRLLGMLRVEAGDDDAGLLPQPGLADLGTLAQTHRDTGLEVALGVSGHRRDLPPGLDLAAYRIVQEALTNVRKHALGATHARVRIAFEPQGLGLEVTDDGSAGTPGADGVGHGLVGMRERVTLYGGSLQSGPQDRGGWRVSAMLPVPALSHADVP